MKKILGLSAALSLFGFLPLNGHAASITVKLYPYKSLMPAVLASGLPARCYICLTQPANGASCNIAFDSVDLSATQNYGIKSYTIDNSKSFGINSSCGPYVNGKAPDLWGGTTPCSATVTCIVNANGLGGCMGEQVVGASLITYTSLADPARASDPNAYHDPVSFNFPIYYKAAATCTMSGGS